MAGTYDFGLVGLGVMGRNFILNVADNGFSAFGLDTDSAKVDDLRKEGAGKSVDGTTSKESFVSSLAIPRKIMLLVPAGKPVDSVISDLLPHLDKGDLIIDGGNSHYDDTNRRYAELNSKGIHFIGSGVSGGSQGARFGPSIMPGGNPVAYEIIRPVFEAVSAKVNGEPCVDFMGSTSAGNYVKMVHNGIEYGLMQLISEAYDIMKQAMKMSDDEIGKTFKKWNQGKLKSFLLEITGSIFDKKDELSSNLLVEMILDKAKQKGTGKWTSQNGMDLGSALPGIDSAVSMRQISGLKEFRTKAEKLYAKPNNIKSELTTADLEDGLYFAFIVTYAQGMSLLQLASIEYQYELNLERIAKIWRGGCIIRAELLEDMRLAFSQQPELESLLLDKNFAKKLSSSLEGARRVMRSSIDNSIPMLSFSASYHYFLAMTTARLPLNLVQAQRDYFGSHTYERVDREGIFHTDW